MHTSTETPTVSSFLQRYPWLPAETGGRKALDFLWQFRVKAPLEDLWPFLIDTSTFNRLLGLPEMQYEEKNGRLFGRSVNAGIVSEWEEVPWEWEYHKGLNNARIYSRGFATYVRSRYILAADGRETILQVYFGWVPRTWWGGLLLKIGMPRLRNDYERALGKIATIISERRDFAERQRSIQVLAAPVAANESAVTRMAALRQKAVTEGAPETALKKLCDYVLEAPEDELARIRIKVAARHLNENAGDLTAAALYATRVGILSLSWDVTCPHCRGVRESVTSLGDIPREGRCEACDITFSSEEIGNLEIVFHVNPEIRSVAKKFFCAAEPATKRHIRVQRRVAAGSELSLQTDLEPGEYRVRLAGQKYYLPLLVGEGSTRAELVVPGPAVRVAEHPELAYRNSDAGDATLVIERREEDNDALRPGELFNRQVFRDLYGAESLAEGLQIELGNQNILFTDIVGSTALYRQNGDGEAFAAVRRHFQIIYEIVRRFNGAVVKTIGDSAMVAFADGLQCARAAITLQQAFAGQGAAGGVLLRVSVHSGPCLAVNLNSGIDYFGNTVNFAAKLQQVAGAHEIAFSAEFVADQQVMAFLSTGGFTPVKRAFAPQWSDAPFDVYVTHV